MGGLPCFKVKHICFVDTVVMLTSVNVNPELFFLPVGANSGTIHHADHTGACDCML